MVPEVKLKRKNRPEPTKERCRFCPYFILSVRYGFHLRQVRQLLSEVPQAFG